MNETTDVAGTIEADPDGRFDLPDRYAEADAIVIRDPSKTVDMPRGEPIDWWYFDPRPDKNPDLAPDKVSLKVYGEDAEVYRIENADAIDPGEGE